MNKRKILFLPNIISTKTKNSALTPAWLPILSACLYRKKRVILPPESRIQAIWKYFDLTVGLGQVQDVLPPKKKRPGDRSKNCRKILLTSTLDVLQKNAEKQQI